MATTNYDVAMVFTKHTDMMSWFDGKFHNTPSDCDKSVGFNQLKNSYARPRDVQLILLVRYDYTSNVGHIYCRIKCPINPLPIKGEFEVASLNALVHLIEREGWKMQNKLPISLLK